VKIRLTQRQLALIRTVRKRIERTVENAGLTIVYTRRGPAGSYSPDEKKIFLRRSRACKDFVPHVLDQLFTLAHELGHHRSHENHAKIGYDLEYDLPTDMLFEEVRAFDEARAILRRHGLRGKDLWYLYNYASWGSIEVDASSFAATHWMAVQLRRRKIECPDCGSRALDVRGHEKDRNCAIVCRRCRTHTYPQRSTRALLKGLRHKRFTDLCPCFNLACRS